MRKTSHDGGDTTSITSGIENETRKSSAGIMKTTRNSIKRKVQNLSHETDDAVIEPLLQKEKTEISNQSAKYLLSKTKTDSVSDKANDREKLLSDNKEEIPSVTSIPGITGCTSLSNGIKESQISKSYTSATATPHNLMNMNVFDSTDRIKAMVAQKSQVLVEIDKNKQTGYNPSSLIFTTAKIHTNGKTKHMEPVQVTSVPILSTIEGGVVKAENLIDNEEKRNRLGGMNDNNIINTVHAKSTAGDNKQQGKECNVTISNAFNSNSNTSIISETNQFTSVHADESRVQGLLNKTSIGSNALETHSKGQGSTTASETKKSSDINNVIDDFKTLRQETSLQQPKTSISQSSVQYSSPLDIVKTSKIDTISKSEPITVSDEKTLESKRLKTDENSRKSDSAKNNIIRENLGSGASGEIKIDLNKNPQCISSIGSQNKSAPENIKPSVNKKVSDVSNYKQLQFKTNVTVEAVGDSEVKPKTSRDNISTGNNIKKISEVSNNKSSEKAVSNKLALQKSSLSNATVSKVTKPIKNIATTTATSLATNEKPSVMSSTSTVLFDLSTVTTSSKVSTVSAISTTVGVMPIVNTKTSTVSIKKPLNNVVVKSTGEMTSTTGTIKNITSAVQQKAATSAKTPIIASPKASAAKSPTISQLTTSVKSTTTSITPNITSAKMISSTTSVNTVRPLKVSTNKSSTSKVVDTPTNKSSLTKSSEINKDGKSKKV